MQTLTVQVTNKTALKVIHSLQEKHLVKIVNDSDLHSPALPGSPLTLKAFKNLIADAESSPTLSLKEARAHSKKLIRKYSQQ